LEITMTRRYVLAALAAAALFVGGWAMAQQGPASPARPAGDAPGRFAVTATPTGAVLVDTATGQTWVLRPGLEGPRGAGLPPAWERAHKLDDPEQAERWKEMERNRKRDMDRAKTEKK
jgi:hypothetical protein